MKLLISSGELYPAYWVRKAVHGDREGIDSNVVVEVDQELAARLLNAKQEWDAAVSILKKLKAQRDEELAAKGGASSENLED